MRAFILKPDKTYYKSIVFAIETERDDKYPEYSYSVYYYVVNEENKLVRVNQYVENCKYLNKQVLIRNCEPCNYLPWITKTDLEGYAFVVNSKTLLGDIKKGNAIAPEIEDDCSQINQSNLYWYTNNCDVNEIVDKDDVKDFTYFTSGFHDAHFERIDWINENKLEITFSGVWGFKWFKLIFERNIDSYFEENLDERWLYGANICFKDNKVYFLATDDYDSIDEIKGYGITYVGAEKLTYQYEIEYDWK